MRYHAGHVWRVLGALGFLKDLQRHLKARLLIIWAGAALHRRKLVGDFLASTNGRIVAERFPPDAPELNPGEYGCLLRTRFPSSAPSA